MAEHETQRRVMSLVGFSPEVGPRGRGHHGVVHPKHPDLGQG